MRSARGHVDGCCGSLEDHVLYRAGEGYYATASCRCRSVEARGRKAYVSPGEAEKVARVLLARRIARVIDRGVSP